MRPARVAAAAVLLVWPSSLRCLAADVRDWQSAVRIGDLRFSQNPGYAEWTAATAPARRPGARTARDRQPACFPQRRADVRHRRSRRPGLRQRLLRVARPCRRRGRPHHPRRGARTRSATPRPTTCSGSSPTPTRSRPGPYAPSPVERSESDFRSAVSLDPHERGREVQPRVADAAARRARIARRRERQRRRVEEGPQRRGRRRPGKGLLSVLGTLVFLTPAGGIAALALVDSARGSRARGPARAARPQAARPGRRRLRHGS